MSGDKKIRVGSRKSELALIQTRHVISVLSGLYPDKEFEIVTMSTLGDKVLDIPLPKIGEKSLFTKELETALATGCVDFVVHSLKDLPTVLPEGMAIGAVLEREDPRDALVLKKDSTSTGLNDLKADSVIGTSSLRRTAQLARSHPHLKVESIRGNLNTRMRKLDELDKFSAIVLAQAGLCRMGWQSRVTRVLPCNEMMYAVGQGALAVECRENDVETLAILQPLHCAQTLFRVLAERSFLKTLGGGCSAPVAVSTKLIPSEDKLTLKLKGGVWSLDGKTELKDFDECSVEVRSLSLDPKTGEAICPLGFTKDLAESKGPNSENIIYPCSECPQKGQKDDNITQMCLECPQKGQNSDNITQMCSECPQKEQKNEKPASMKSCPYDVSPCKKQKIDEILKNKDILALENPHEHCPLSIPVGLDFMGKCPYLDDESVLGKCPVNAEIQNLKGEHSGQNISQCPFFKNGKLSVLGESSIAGSSFIEKKITCPYREPKLYCGIVPSQKTPLWALEEAENLGKNLAEKLLKNGALEVMQAAQAQIRNSI